MRSIRLAIVLSLVAIVPAGAASKRAQCQQACTAMIAACTSQNAAAGFGNLAKACKATVQKRCRTEGPAVCGAFCGNGTVDGTEACDGGALGGATCATLGFASGTLACTGSCTLDKSGCTPSRPPDLCGNNGIDAGESCDGTVLGAATCESLGFLLGGTLACTPGCGFDVSGCLPLRVAESGQTTIYTASKNDGLPDPVAVPEDGTLQAGKSLAYRDNGDGTITDLTTGLVWEKKGDDGGLHDHDNLYVWSNNGDGEGEVDTIWDWLDDVNAEGGAGFAGHSDWRIPNVRELASLLTFGRRAPAIEPAFTAPCLPGCTPTTCSCISDELVPSHHWSSTTYGFDPTTAWGVGYVLDPEILPRTKANFGFVRAVRGGS